MASYNNDLNQDDQSRSDRDDDHPGTHELSKVMTWRLYHLLGEFQQAVQKRHDDTDDDDERVIMRDILPKVDTLRDEIEPLL